MLDPPTIRHALSIAFISIPIRAQLALATLSAFLRHEAHRVSALEDSVVNALSTPPRSFRIQGLGFGVENFCVFKGFRFFYIRVPCLLFSHARLCAELRPSMDPPPVAIATLSEPQAHST
jgi:hypothetical protein